MCRITLAKKRYSIPIAQTGPLSLMNKLKRIGKGFQLPLFFMIFFCTIAQAFAIEQAIEQTIEQTAATSLDTRNILFSRIIPDDGLSQASINAIVQDHEGYLWFGTQEGLNRYDGNQIRIYEHDTSKPASLSHDWIWSLLVDKAGTLWAGTDGGGLNRFERSQNAFTHFRHDPDDQSSLSSDRVRVIYQDRQGTFWIGTDGGGLNRFDSDRGKFVRYQHDPADQQSLPNDNVLAIIEDRTGNLWVGTNGGGLALLDRESGKFKQYRHDPSDANSLSNDRVRALYEDRSGRLWVGTYEGGVNWFNPIHGSFKRFEHDPTDPLSLGHNRVRSIFQDRNDNVWLATDGGLNEWRSSEQGFIRYTYDMSDPSSLSDDRVTTIFQDRGGVLWVGTFNGVNKWNYISDVFNYYQESGTRLKLSNNIVTTISESDDGVLWVGNYGGGLNKLDMTSGNVTYYRKGPENSNSLSDDRVMSVYVDQDQVVWVGTRSNGINRLDPISGEITHLRADPKNEHALSANGITSIFGDSNGVLWVGTYGGGLNRRDPVTGAFKAYRHNPLINSSLSSDRVLAIYRDHSGVLWIGTEDGGLNRFNESDGSFERYQHDPDNPQSLRSNMAWAIHEGKEGSLWIGTGGGGLNRWTAARRLAGQAVFKKYGKSDGLSSDSIQAIQEDNAGFLWLSSNRGLNRLDPATGDVRHFSRSNGLRANEFNFAASLHSRTGRLYFGSTEGLIAFQPEHVRTNQHRPDIALAAHSRSGPLSLGYSSDPQRQTFELGYKEDLITFEFVGLDFTAPEKNQYRYKLEGFDKDWTGPVSFTRATYTSLPAGNYNFRVMGANNDGVWSERGGALAFQVIPPPWKNPLAYVVYSLFGVGLVLLYLRWQARKLRLATEQRIELAKQVKLRTQELAQRNDQLLTLNEKLKEVSSTDSLTGLRNRRYLHEYMDTEVAKLARQIYGLKHADNNTVPIDISPVMSFMMIDLDGFKAINDTYGHAAGDRALKQVKDILQTCCRQSDVITRWGGDEFLIIGRHANPSAAEKLAERIRSALANHQYQLGNGHVGALSGSIGFAQYPFSVSKSASINWEQVVCIADRAAYVAKQNGRNAWVGIYSARNISQAECSKIKTELPVLIKNKRVSINTSIEGELVFEKLDSSLNA
jgi:diguanylate cyclase (GGDEF)-like protein